MPAHARPCLLISVRWTWFVNLASVVVLAAAVLIGLNVGKRDLPAQAAAASVPHTAPAVPGAAGTAMAAAGLVVPDSAQPLAATRSATAGPSTDNGPASLLAADGIPVTALDAYQDAAAREASVRPSCGLQWPLLAAIGRVESDHNRFDGAVLHADGLATPPVIGPPLNGHGTALILDTDHGVLDGDRVYDHAVGPMQFIPSTWAIYGVDGNGDGIKDPFNIFDAAAAAADYLCIAGGNLTTIAGQTRAVFAYNHSDSYVTEVLQLEQTYAAGGGVILAGDTGSTGGASVQPTPEPQPTLPPVDPGRPPALPPTSGPTSGSPGPTTTAGSSTGADPSVPADPTATSGSGSAASPSQPGAGDCPSDGASGPDSSPPTAGGGILDCGTTTDGPPTTTDGPPSATGGVGLDDPGAPTSAADPTPDPSEAATS